MKSGKIDTQKRQKFRNNSDEQISITVLRNFEINVNTFHI